MKVVHGTKADYKCEFCGKAFKCKDYLTQHQKGRNGRGGCSGSLNLVKRDLDSNFDQQSLDHSSHQ